jgi:hypothetical protein
MGSGQPGGSTILQNFNFSMSGPVAVGQTIFGGLRKDKEECDEYAKIH